MSRELIIAVDPGMSGGIAWQFAGGQPHAQKMPLTEGDIVALVSELHSQLPPIHSPVEAYVEDVPIGMPGKGAACAKLNANAGFVRGVIAAKNFATFMVRPAKWQQHFSLGKRSGCASDTEWKNKLKQCAQRLYPNIKVTLDTADALLLLSYAKAQP